MNTSVPSPRLVRAMRALAVLFALLMVELLAAAAFGFDPIAGPVLAWQVIAQACTTVWNGLRHLAGLGLPAVGAA